MTEQEKIEALKVNEKPFALMDKELRDSAVKIGKKYLVVFTGLLWNQEGEKSRFIDVDTYRLRIDYQPKPAEPEEIELPIGEWGGSFTVVLFGSEKENWLHYTCAPCIIPKPDYRFAGYRYEHGEVVLPPVLLQKSTGCVAFPVAAVYRKQTS